MSTAKSELMKFIEDLPEDLTQEDLEREVLQNIRYRRHIRSMVARAEEDIEQGRTISHEELKQKRGFS